MIHMNVERKGLAVSVGKNPVVVMGHLPLFGRHTTGGQIIYRCASKNRKRLSTNCMKAFAGTFGSPAIMLFQR